MLIGRDATRPIKDVLLRRAPLHIFSASHYNLNGSGPGEKNNKSERVSGIVQGAGPNVEAGRSLGTTGLTRQVSDAIRRSLVIFPSAVSVQWCFLNPD